MDERKLTSVLIERRYVKKDGRFFSAELVGNSLVASGAVDLRSKLKSRFPNFYRTVVGAIALFDQGIGERKAIDIAFPKGTADTLIVNLGSGVKEGGEGVVNVDLFPLEHVHVIASADRLPFKDGSVDMVFTVSLLEHVKNQTAVIAEITRVLKPQGFVYISMPFMYPFHSSPHDFARLTRMGLRHHLSGYEMVKEGIDSGPVTAVLIQLSYIGAQIFSFGSKKVYEILINFFMIATVPIRVFDFVVSVLPNAEDGAASLYVLARKN